MQLTLTPNQDFSIAVGPGREHLWMSTKVRGTVTLKGTKGSTINLVLRHPWTEESRPSIHIP